jgi:hypothetical protein
MTEVTDDVFKNILQCDDAYYAALFVDHNANTAFLLLEIQQLCRQRRTFGHEVGFAAGGQDGVFV